MQLFCLENMLRITGRETPVQTDCNQTNEYMQIGQFFISTTHIGRQLLDQNDNMWEQLFLRKPVGMYEHLICALLTTKMRQIVLDSHRS